MKKDIIFYNRLGKKIKKPHDSPVEERLSVYGIAIINNRILMVEPVWNPVWEIPGGKVENNENEDVALLREFKEETGYLIKEMDKNYIDCRENNFYKEDVDIYYHETQKFYVLTSIIKLQKFNVNPKEIKKVEWVDLFSLNSNNCNKIYLMVIDKLIKKFKNDYESHSSVNQSS